MGRSDLGGREFSNQLMRDTNLTIAEEMGYDGPLPMDDPNFDFYTWGTNFIVRAYRLRGQDLDNMTGDVIQNLVYNPRTGDKGVLYNYPKYEHENPDFPFDRYFKMGFKKRSQNEMAKRAGYGKNRRKKHVSIMPGRPDEMIPGGGVSEEELQSGFPSPMASLEEEDRQKLLRVDIPAQIENQRDGKILSEFYRMYYLGGAKLREIAEHLNQLSVNDSDYWTPRGGMKGWNAGMVQRLEKIVGGIVLNYFQKKKLTQEDITGSTGERAIFQARRA